MSYQIYKLPSYLPKFAMGGDITPNTTTKTVLVLGAAYGGTRAAHVLAEGLPADWKVIVIDRNSHMHHVYAMPRFSVLPGHEYKAFIPYTNVFRTQPSSTRHVLQAHIVSMRPHHITLSKAFPEHGFSNEIPFDFAIYALGSRLPSPLDLWGTTPNGKPVTRQPQDRVASPVYLGDKSQGCSWLLKKQKIIKRSATVLVVGGGALESIRTGRSHHLTEYATDIKAVYPSKRVTLLHSRLQLLNRFDPKMHDEALGFCREHEIEVILGERLDMNTVNRLGIADIVSLEKKVVPTVTGREIAADMLILCTGQSPNTALMKAMDPRTVKEYERRIRVMRTLQISPIEGLPRSGSCGVEAHTPYPHIFAIGDAADAFGAIMAGHTAYYQGEVAARNIIRLVERREAEKSKLAGLTGALGEEKPLPDDLEIYTPGPPAIKVSLGLTHAVYQIGEEVGTKDDGVPDMSVRSIWPLLGMKVDTDEDMRV